MFWKVAVHRKKFRGCDGCSRYHSVTTISSNLPTLYQHAGNTEDWERGHVTTMQPAPFLANPTFPTTRTGKPQQCPSFRPSNPPVAGSYAPHPSARNSTLHIRLPRALLPQQTHTNLCPPPPRNTFQRQT
ncbi:hypothetical protein BJ508DRAFT_141253 [Ascobolus immersus RN42]|uniref:Uncharacterized protein n=1 Tax=Ascobolus immersus RN42 TaxID=1160509 RepID=A0A3N4I213_ASCIM|nr:hypothetical protein BJ508DRAFT_141253 [Ascobolus immersus RN42]